MNALSVEQAFVSEIREGYELTAQQEQVWLREQQNRGEAWLWGAVRVQGEFELERVQRAVRRVAEAEEVLRSGFARLAGMDQPLQVLRSESAVVVEVEDAETAVLEERIEQWGRSGQWDEAGDQWGVKLWRVCGETILGVRMRPLCGDRETVRSVIAEVRSGYERDLQRVEDGETQQRVQYADYGAWQKEVRDEGAEGRAYWEREQRGLGRELRLGLERGAVGGEWRRQRVAVAGEVVEQIRRVAAAERVSEAAVLLSVWQLLLWRHTEAEVVEVETYFDGRKYEDLRDALGRYGRYLPISFRFEKDFGFIEVVRWIDESISSASLYQDCWRETGLGSSGIGFEYVSWITEWLEERVGGQKLKLRVESEASGLTMQLEYDDGVLSAAAAEWLSEQYVQLLGEVSGAPEQLVSEAVLVSAREQQQVLSGWNAVQLFESEGARNVAQLFEARVEQRPEATAIVSGSEELSFGELN
ncbi:MAG TPA: condensation domain-containing protein, partial [Pyrinomonadaceae bacterium]|nr:condensation domain-containing protein [Pyrinomonadaceae bacterium]